MHPVTEVLATIRPYLRRHCWIRRKNVQTIRLEPGTCCVQCRKNDRELRQSSVELVRAYCDPLGICCFGRDGSVVLLSYDGSQPALAYIFFTTRHKGGHEGRICCVLRHLSPKVMRELDRRSGQGIKRMLCDNCQCLFVMAVNRSSNLPSANYIRATRQPVSSLAHGFDKAWQECHLTTYILHQPPDLRTSKQLQVYVHESAKGDIKLG